MLEIVFINQLLEPQWAEINDRQTVAGFLDFETKHQVGDQSLRFWCSLSYALTYSGTLEFTEDYV